MICSSLLLVTFVTVVAPRYLLSWDAPGTPVSGLAKAINDIRTTLLQGLAGIALLIGAFFSWRQLQVSNQSQITQRFAAAVEQLGSPSPGVRLGAIFALERIADDSPYDRVTIAEVLCAFVQSSGPADPPSARPVARDPAHKLELALMHRAADSLSVRRTDRQAAMTVLGRRALVPNRYVLGLARTDLRGTRLAFADLEKADLHYSDLSDVNLESADLGADLTGIWLAGSFLRGARLHQADLRGADLTGTEASRASLAGAVADASTVWPADFDAAAAGVVTADDSAPLPRPQTWYDLPR
ncbi:pentapeptide repeat-containing protein [Streptomyces sp. NPDC050610]|uniref:pentapeptide repeat-containing protein n=1 Tax=Streptomyces sp. NPDC050610 TaxID=3157097 RepID=UPI00343A6AE9